MAEKVIKNEKKFNWILWSVIGIVIIGLIVGGIFIAKAILDKNNDNDDRITMFDSYTQLPFSYFLKDYVYEDPTTTTTTEEGTTTTEPKLEGNIANEYYLFIYDGTKSCTEYGCSSAFSENIGYDKFLEEVKSVLDTAVANGVQVYVADVSQEWYTGYEAFEISALYNFTGIFTNGSTADDGKNSIIISAPALIKVTGNEDNKYQVNVYYSGVENIYKDIAVKLENYEDSWNW